MNFKDLYIQAHEDLISEAMERDPTLTWNRAYDTLADKAYDRAKDNLADMADNLRQRQKEEQG